MNATRRGEHVSHAVADDRRAADGHAKSLGGGAKEVGVGLGVLHLVVRDDDRVARVDAVGGGAVEMGVVDSGAGGWPAAARVPDLWTP